MKHRTKTKLKNMAIQYWRYEMFSLFFKQYKYRDKQLNAFEEKSTRIFFIKFKKVIYAKISVKDFFYLRNLFDKSCNGRISLSSKMFKYF